MKTNQLLTLALLATGCSSDPMSPAAIDSPVSSPVDAPPLPDANVSNPAVLWLDDLGSESNLRLVATSGPPSNF